MRLSDYTDYTLRVLICCAHQGEQLLTIAQIAQTLQVSKNHLMKVVNALARQGVLETTRGRGGGIRLLKAPSEIGIGDVLRRSETDFRLVECFDANTDTCTLTPGCRLRGLLHRALQAYFKELDAMTLADIALPVGRPPGARTPLVPVALPRSRRRLTT